MTNIYHASPAVEFLLTTVVWNFFGYFLLDPMQGASSALQVALCSDAEAEKLQGKYFSDGQILPMNPLCQPPLSKELWDKSREMLKL